LLDLSGAGLVYREAIAQEVVAQDDSRMATGPTVLTVEQEKAKAGKPGSDFKECANGCPVMIVVPAGKFIMGSPKDESDREGSERPQHEVTIARPFAVSKFEVTFEEWDACVAAAACPASPRQLGTRADACDQHKLARRQAVCRLALAVDRQGVPASDRGRMGVRRAGWRPPEGAS
jgi:formylglycine-generating enzyme required for sulfatase activity